MGFLVVFLIPGIVIFSVALGARSGHPNLAIWIPWIVGYVFVPLIQMRWPREPWPTASNRAASPAWAVYYRVLPLLALPVQLGMLAVTTAAFASGRYDLPGRLVLTLTTGVFSAMFAVNIAHELIHRREWLDRVFGGLLLSTVSFGTFKIVHLQVHHPYVGTPLDFATARRGQTIYSFWLRALAGNFLEAFRRERVRLRRSGKPVWTSELVPWSVCTLVCLTASVYWFGPLAGLFFVMQSLIAIMYLDLINFLQHYGLTRQLGSGGRPEPVQDHHSWTAAMFLDDLLLLNLPRHAHHHSQPQRPYHLLEDSPHAPRYPYSYGVMTMLLLVPALFRRVVHPCLDRFEAARAMRPLPK
jgi:alkane 1-monooxygenase